jgi:predicted PurR-regulated permease PerM
MLPPFLGLLSIVVFGTLFGLIGIILAVPLAVAVMTLVQRLWVKGVLDEQAEVLGQQGGSDGGDKP